MSKAVTVVVEMIQSTIDRDLVATVGTSIEYRRVAMAAPVIGKVYALQANENLNPLKKLTRTACKLKNELRTISYQTSIKLSKFISSKRGEFSNFDSACGIYI